MAGSICFEPGSRRRGEARGERRQPDPAPAEVPRHRPGRRLSTRGSPHRHDPRPRRLGDQRPSGCDDGDRRPCRCGRRFSRTSDGGAAATGSPRHDRDGKSSSRKGSRVSRSAARHSAAGRAPWSPRTRCSAMIADGRWRTRTTGGSTIHLRPVPTVGRDSRWCGPCPTIVNAPPWRASRCVPNATGNTRIRRTAVFTPSRWRARNAARSSGSRTRWVSRWDQPEIRLRRLAGSS